MSSVTKVTLVKWPYLCAVRHGQRLVLSVELSLQIAVQKYNKKLHEFSSGESRILEDGQNDRHEEADSIHTQFAHASCTVRAYNSRLATTFLTSIHTYIRLHYQQHPTPPLIVVFTLRPANQPTITVVVLANHGGGPAPQNTDRLLNNTAFCAATLDGVLRNVVTIHLTTNRCESLNTASRHHNLVKEAGERKAQKVLRTS